LLKKNYLVQKWKEQELQLQKQPVEVEGKREDHSREQHQDIMKILLEQTKQQQQQMQNFQQFSKGHWFSCCGEGMLLQIAK